MAKTGRPPKLFTSEELPSLGEDLLHWVYNEGKENLMFVDWYFVKHGMTLQDWKELTQRPGFREHYEIARRKLAENVVKNKDIPQSYGNRYLGLYDRDVHDYEKEVKTEEAAIKNKEANDFKELAENLQKMGSFLDRWKSMQTSGSKEDAKCHKELPEQGQTDCLHIVQSP
jgi:hypothetical protein